MNQFQFAFANGQIIWIPVENDQSFWTWYGGGNCTSGMYVVHTVDHVHMWTFTAVNVLYGWLTVYLTRLWAKLARQLPWSWQRIRASLSAGNIGIQTVLSKKTQFVLLVSLSIQTGQTYGLTILLFNIVCVACSFITDVISRKKIVNIKENELVEGKRSRNVSFSPVQCCRGACNIFWMKVILIGSESLLQIVHGQDHIIVAILYLYYSN